VQTLELRLGFATSTSPYRRALGLVDYLKARRRTLFYMASLDAAKKNNPRQRRLDRVVGLARLLSILLFVLSLPSLITLAFGPRLPRNVRVDLD